MKHSSFPAGVETPLWPVSVYPSIHPGVSTAPRMRTHTILSHPSTPAKISGQRLFLAAPSPNPLHSLLNYPVVFIPLKHLPSSECPSLTPHLLPWLPIYLFPSTAVLLERDVYSHVAFLFPLPPVHSRSASFEVIL